MNPYCAATWISSKLAWSVWAEAPCAELLFAPQGEPGAAAVPQPSAEGGSNPSGLRAPGSQHHLMMSADHVEKLHAAQQSC